MSNKEAAIKTAANFLELAIENLLANPGKAVPDIEKAGLQEAYEILKSSGIECDEETLDILRDGGLIHENERTVKANGRDRAEPEEDDDKEEDRGWPAPLGEAAFHGIAGEIARAIEPLSESDTAAVLIQTLVAFGALVGRGAHWEVEEDKHYPNLFALLVGATADARKGISWGRVRSIFELCDAWVKVWDGDMSTGEGLKYQVRDPSVKKKSRSRKYKKDLGDQDEYDEGISDKRLLVIASEFGYALKVMSRPGNTLSATLRQAWDRGNLATMTRNDPIVATNAHIAIVGHVTPEELVKELTDSDANNGFMNRFLLVCSKKARDMPLGGKSLPLDIKRGYAARLARAAGNASGRMELSTEAGEVWSAAYGGLTTGMTGLSLVIASRAHPLVMRLALIYALLDERTAIYAEHIKAGLAVWDYCASSVRHVFGGATLGNRYMDPARGCDVADKLEKILKATPGGMTLTMITRRFNGKLPAMDRDMALASLKETWIARCEKHRVEGSDKPVERWFYAR